MNKDGVHPEIQQWIARINHNHALSNPRPPAAKQLFMRDEIDEPVQVDRLLSSAQKLVKLLENPHPDLTSWAIQVDEQIDEIFKIRH